MGNHQDDRILSEGKLSVELLPDPLLALVEVEEGGEGEDVAEEAHDAHEPCHGQHEVLCVLYRLRGAALVRPSWYEVGGCAVGER